MYDEQNIDDIYMSDSFICGWHLRTYYDIVNRARERECPEGYTEKHHVIPKCLGGSNNQDNLVVLTAREHFLCHWLMVKMTVSGTYKYYKLRRAFIGLTFTRNGLRVLSSKQYDVLRKAAAKLHSEIYRGENHPMYGRKHTAETIKKISEASSKQKWTDERRKKMAKAMKAYYPSGSKAYIERGKKISKSKKEWYKNNDHPFLGKKRPEHAEIMREKMLGENNPMYNVTGEQHPMYGRSHKEESKRKMSVSVKKFFSENDHPFLGKKHTEETKQQMKESAKNRKRITCEHCNGSYTPGMYARWHGEKCRK